MSVSSSTARASKDRFREALDPLYDVSEGSPLPCLPQRTVGRPVVWERVTLLEVELDSIEG